MENRRENRKGLWDYEEGRPPLLPGYKTPSLSFPVGQWVPEVTWPTLCLAESALLSAVAFTRLREGRLQTHLSKGFCSTGMSSRGLRGEGGCCLASAHPTAPDEAQKSSSVVRQGFGPPSTEPGFTGHLPGGRCQPETAQGLQVWGPQHRAGLDTQAHWPRPAQACPATQCWLLPGMASSSAASGPQRGCY